MRLDALTVQNCRNIALAHLAPHAHLTVIAGANGQGKTNLLECIYLLSGGKSFRGAKDQDLVRHGEGQGHVTGSCLSGGRQQEIAITVEGAERPRRGRFASINGVDYGRATAIAGHFTAVVFEPGHLSLIKAGPEGRRRFLDAALCQLYPGYVATLRRFTRALSQKNALLRHYHDIPDAAGMLDAFDETLVAAGGEITRRRAEYLQQAGPAAERFYAELSSGAEALAIAFLPSAQPGGLAEVLAAARPTDVRAGHATAGPQREDFEVLLAGQSARQFASQGQQRSAVLSLKLAEAATAQQVTGEHPVLLLDDVLSELDETRQAYLLGHMGAGQSFVTTCDATAFSRTAGTVVHVQNGAVLP
ncbi:MAG: DNA replication/repair protein RecF [Oscillospiraceae bacterium]